MADGNACVSCTPGLTRPVHLAVGRPVARFSGGMYLSPVEAREMAAALVEAAEVAEAEDAAGVAGAPA